MDIVAGRDHSVEGRVNNYMITIFNIHSFSLNSADRRKLFGKIERAKRGVSCLVIILGDFNFHPAGEASTKFGMVNVEAQ